MPRAAKQLAKPPVGPYDLSTVQLPGGDEFTALSAGFTRLTAHRDGYIEAASIANKNILRDATAQQPWIIADAKTGLLRSQNAAQLFEGPYATSMEELFTPEGANSNISARQFSKGHAWRHAVKMGRKAPLTGTLSDIGKSYVRLEEGVFLHHRPNSSPIQPITAKPPPAFTAARYPGLTMMTSPRARRVAPR